jgi:hypothetical protein
MAAITWEQALGAFASSTDSIVSRSDVTGSSAPPFGNIGTGKMSEPQLFKLGAAPTFDSMTAWAMVSSYDYALATSSQSDGTSSVTREYYVFSIEMNGDVFGNPYSFAGNRLSKYGQFIRQPETILLKEPLDNHENDTTSPHSFYYAGTVWNDLAAWVEDRVGDVDGLGGELNSGGGLSGATADSYGASLDGLKSQLKQMHFRMDPAQVQFVLQGAAWNLLAALGGLRTAFYGSWAQTARANPIYLYNEALAWALQSAIDNNGVQNTGGGAAHKWSISTPLGDPTSPDFWKALDAEVQRRWVAHLVDSLDPLAHQVMMTLQGRYADAGAFLNNTKSNLSGLSSGPPPTSTAGLNGGGPGGADSGLAGLDNNLSAGLGGISDGITSGLGGISDGITSGLGGIGDGITSGLGGVNDGLTGLGGALSAGLGGVSGALGGVGGDLTSGPFGVSSTGLGGIGGATVGDQVIGPDGSPVLGPAGLPIMVPAGSRVNPDGTIIGPGGSPVLGADGKPLTVPPGSSLRPSPLGPASGLVNTPLIVPPGSTISVTGGVVGPGGQPLRGPDGGLLKVPVGSTVSPDGTVLGPDGKPVEVGAVAGSIPVGDVPVPPALMDVSPLTGSGAALLPGGGLGGFTVVSGAPSGGGGVLPGVPAGALAAEEAAAFARTPSSLSMTAAEEMAAEQASVISRASSSSTPFIPPMTGGGATASGSTPQKRRTWLEEDEEVWGTESKTLDGVIGR